MTLRSLACSAAVVLLFAATPRAARAYPVAPSPSHPKATALVQEARVASGRGDLTSAAASLRAALALEDARDTRKMLADVLAWKGELDEAIALYRALRRSSDDDALALSHANALAWKKADPSALTEALALYDAHLAKHPDDKTVLLQRARARGWAGQAPGAADDFERYLAAKPDAAILLEQAKVLSWSKNRDDILRALGVFDAYLQKNPADDEALLARARAAGWAGRSEESAKSYESYFSRHAEDLTALRAAAIQLSVGADPARSVPFFRRYLERAPGDAEINLQFARTLLWTADHDAAERILLQLLAKAPGDDVDIEYARLLAQTRRPVRALEMVEAVLARSPAHEQAKKLYEILLLGVRSSVGGAIGGYVDRNEISLFWANTYATWWLSRRVAILAEATPYRLGDARETIHALQINAGVRYRPSDALEVEALAGPRLYEYFAPHGGGRVVVTGSPNPHVKVRAEYAYDDAYPLLLQPATLSARVRLHAASLTPEVQWWRVSLAGRGGFRVGSPTNLGFETSGRALLRVAGPLSVGYAVQWLKWQYNDLTYWSPQGYASHLGLLRVAGGVGSRFGYDLQAGAGSASERIEYAPATDTGFAWTGGGVLTYAPIPTLQLRLSATYSQTVRQVVREIAGGTSGGTIRLRDESRYYWMTGTMGVTWIL